MTSEIYNFIEEIISTYNLEKLNDEITKELSTAKSAAERLFLKTTYCSNSSEKYLLPSFVIYDIIQDLKYKKIKPDQVPEIIIKKIKIPFEIANQISYKLLQNEHIIKEISKEENAVDLTIPIKNKGSTKGIGQELI